MKSVLDTYLGWDEPRHMDECRRPSWEVAVRTGEETRYSAQHHYGQEPAHHKCKDEFCGHGGDFEQVTVRIVCRSCGAAQVVTGEKTEDTGVSDTSTWWLGYGMAPRQAAGLLLWPAAPWLPYGRGLDAEPHDFVVTRTGVKAVTQDSVVGQIMQSTGRRKGVIWAALAVPSPDGPYGAGQPVKYAHRNDGYTAGDPPLRTVRAAARWVGARLAERAAGSDAA
ncbi:hypothetical protein ABZX40_36510 [Streptomyces sp. NPDC004610]|uniref:hypothetical protein n=1 Tax=unclassified Streptomyces TaxID=2593676 RepID=UPI00339EBE26